MPILEQAHKMKGTILEQAKNNAHTRTVAKKGCSILRQEVSLLGRTEFGTIQYANGTQKKPHTRNARETYWST